MSELVSSAIGLVKGPGQSPHTLTIVSSDDKRQFATVHPGTRILDESEKAE